LEGWEVTITKTKTGAELISCSVCENFLSSRAAACPSCGHPGLGQKTIEVQIESIRANTARAADAAAGIYCIIKALVIIWIICAVIYVVAWILPLVL
jgi:hypothetical protein